MIKLTATEREILRVIKEWQDRYRNSPHTYELAHAIGRNPGTINHALIRLQLKGFLEFEHPHRRRLIVPLYWE